MSANTVVVLCVVIGLLVDITGVLVVVSANTVVVLCVVIGLLVDITGVLVRGLLINDITDIMDDIGGTRVDGIGTMVDVSILVDDIGTLVILFEDISTLGDVSILVDDIGTLVDVSILIGILIDNGTLDNVTIVLVNVTGILVTIVLTSFGEGDSLTSIKIINYY